MSNFFDESPYLTRDVLWCIAEAVIEENDRKKHLYKKYKIAL
jgi:hypothetical protein